MPLSSTLTAKINPTTLITPKQVNFIRSLATQRVWEDVLNGTHCMVVKLTLRAPVDELPNVKRLDASTTITALLSCGKKNAGTPTSKTIGKPVNGASAPGFAEMQNLLIQIPQSKYALTDGHGNLYFCEVVKRKNGTYWANRLVGAPGDWKREFLNITQSMAIGLRIMNAGPKNAAHLYCERFTRCSCCDSPLSNGKSIEQAMGPVCSKKFH
jgi:hypothetical protein